MAGIRRGSLRRGACTLRDARGGNGAGVAATVTVLLRVIAAASLAAGAMLLPGCATTRAEALPGGGQGLLVDCSGASLSWMHCYRKAGEQCSRGYAIVKRSNKGGGHFVGGDLLQIFGNQADHRQLLIRCKGARPAARRA